MEVPLQVSAHRTILRVDQTVRRPMYPWSPTVHELLLHLESVSYPHSPRFLGIDDLGREVLTYIEGTCGADGYVPDVTRGADVWAMVASDEGLRRFARFLREYHDAVDGFGDLDSRQVYCHNDFGPWNVVWRDGHPVGLIDWDHAAPGMPIDDVAYALEWTAPFCDDEECVILRRFSTPPPRAHRIAVFAAAYGLSDAVGLVDAVLARQQATIDEVRRLAALGMQPQQDWAAADNGRELHRRRDWALAHRSLFD